MPYPNEHAARIHAPDRYKKFRRENDAFAKGIHVIWGITDDGTVEVQAIRFAADEWTVEEAKKWLKEHDYSPIAFEPATSASADVTAEQARKKKICGVAYSGGPLRLDGWRYPVVIDLAGLSIPETVPLLANHENKTGARVGIVRARIVNDTIQIDGEIISSGDEAREILQQIEAGAGWQLSIGAETEQVELVQQKRKVNGVEHSGPFYHVRKATLREISVLPVGADASTELRLAASWHLGKDPENVIMETEPNKSSEQVDVEVLEKAKKEADRRRSILAAFSEAVAGREDVVDMDGLQLLTRQALDEGWTTERYQLELLRASRPWPLMPRKKKHNPPSQQVLTAALLLSCRMDSDRLAADRDFGEQVVEQAWKYRRCGFSDIFAMALRAEGEEPPPNAADLYQTVTAHARVRAGWSTIDLSGLLGTAANKLLLDAFQTTEATYNKITRVIELPNFLTYNIYRLENTGTFERVPPTGEIKHGTLTETAYTQKLDTRGQLISISRELIVNDDVGAFRQIFEDLGRKARIALEEAVYEEVMESADSFYTSARGNKLTSTPLTLAGLESAEAAMLKMTDSAGNPIYVAPKYLLVPPNLKATALAFYQSEFINQVPASNAGQGSANTFRGRFEVVTSPWLSNSNMAGYSTTTWYLIADPASCPAFQTAFLRGKQQPTVETSDTDFTTLGVQLRCYFDFSVAQLDYRGAIKCTA